MSDPWWIDWIPWQAFAALIVIYFVVGFAYLVLVNHDIIEHRLMPKKGTEKWDWVWLATFNALVWAIIVVAWLDVGTGHGSLPVRLWPVGLTLFVLGGGLFTRAMGENPFFEKTVRIQSERGHHVIDTGPYRIVRHPGYVGLAVWLVSFPLLLTSAWALLPAVLAIVCLVVRTALEDRTLQTKLSGYRDYAACVRFRLVPGLW